MYIIYINSIKTIYYVTYIMRICDCCNSKKEMLIKTINLSLVNDIKLNNLINIYYCDNCNFYYSDSDNTQEDYNNYYTLFNNYKQGVVYSNKDEKCSIYLKNKLQNKNVKNILDYGSGNGILKDFMSDNYNVDNFDIGMNENTKKYDCLLLSHVLEHIYHINEFVKKISLNIIDDGLLYIEVPNVEYYNEFTDICPLQEINIEHINFFSKYALNKLLSNNGFFAISLEDDYFTIKSSKYYVIRGIFQKKSCNNSFMKYVVNGDTIIKNYNFSSLKKYENIYLYGCGQFLFKIFDKIFINTNIINIIDDNPCYLNKKIKNVKIINFELYIEISKNNDVVLLTSIIHDNALKNKIQTLQKHITILNVNEL